MKRLFLSAAVLALSVFGRPAFAWIHDRDLSRIDDRIERTHAVGIAAAHENDDVSRRHRKELVDKVSAVLILQGYLDAKKQAAASDRPPA